MSAELQANDIEHLDQHDYRVLSKAALFSLVLGMVSLLTLVDPGLLILPLVGIICGVTGLISVYRRPDELSGKVPALSGCLLSLAWLIGSGTYHSYMYATEVPEGFERISFYELQPDPQTPEKRIPERALELDGKRIFVKGYVHPGVKGIGPVKTFLLVPDMKACCFGGTPKMTDMISVTLTGGERVEYSLRKRKLAGVLRVYPAITDPLQGTCYQMEAEYVK